MYLEIHFIVNCESAQNDNIQINTCQEEPSTQTSGFYMELMESQYKTPLNIYMNKLKKQPSFECDVDYGVPKHNRFSFLVDCNWFGVVCT